MSIIFRTFAPQKTQTKSLKRMNTIFIVLPILTILMMNLILLAYVGITKIDRKK